MWQALDKAGFETPFYQYCPTLDDVVQVYKDFQTSKREAYEIDIDGLVVSCDQRDWHDKLGWSQQRPNFNRAVKFYEKRFVTIIKDVEWDVGDSGRLSCVALIEPVNTGKVAMKRVNLHNMRYIREKGIKIGSKVTVYLAGLIIPQVDSVLD